MQPHHLISDLFQKRECIEFIADHRDTSKCCCGATRVQHKALRKTADVHREQEQWDIEYHTKNYPTDTHGCLEFHGDQHPSRAKYVRLSFDTDPAKVMVLLNTIWKLPPPKLVISVHGDILGDSNLKPKLEHAFKQGLLKAVRTTGAWIITPGLNNYGVVRQVANALNDAGTVRSRSKIISIGIVPWGVIKSQLPDGPDANVSYHAKGQEAGGEVALNSAHSFFLMADNGTTGRYGAEVILRKRFEEYLCMQITSERQSVPVIGLILGGGILAIRSILDYVTQKPPIPVIICSGTGRACNLMTALVKEGQRSGGKVSLRSLGLSTRQSEMLYYECVLAMRKSKLITFFEIGEETQIDLDYAILSSLLKNYSGHRMNQQLALCMSWNRPDLASSLIFATPRLFPPGTLDSAMFAALENNQYDFVKLLIKNGVQMDKFLTFQRLEKLYNSPKGPPNLLSVLMRGFSSYGRSDNSVKLPLVGQLIEKLMGGTYRSSYCQKEFQSRYKSLIKKTSFDEDSRIRHVKRSNVQVLVVRHTEMRISYLGNLLEQTEPHFTHPFSALFTWCVLTYRHQMALIMWNHGEQALTKALIAIKLYRSMAEEALTYDLETEANELHFYQKHYEFLSLELLDHCFISNRQRTLQLLTYELEHWGRKTNLALSVIAGHQDFVAHPCCQTLISDLWHGGMKFHGYSNLKVLTVLMCPAFVVLLHFKSKDELLLQPQRTDEHTEVRKNQLSTWVSEEAQEESFYDRVQQEWDMRQRPPLPYRRTHDPDPDHQIYNFKTAFGSHGEPLPPSKKFYEFFMSPITTFWTWTISYFIFLFVFTFVVLERTQEVIKWPEWYLLAYVTTSLIESARRILISDGRTLVWRIALYYNNWLNILSMIAKILFLIAMLARLSGDLRVVRLILACDIVIWYTLLFDIMSVHDIVGVYISMLRKMLLSMFYLLCILMVIMMAFGTVRQSIHYPHKDWDWQMARNIVYKPYFMLYGEIYVNEIDPCGDYGINCDIYGHWLTPIFMAFYMIISNVLVINLMIATFNYIFTDVNAKAEQLWKFVRYSVLITYEYKPVIPPPFIIIFHIYFIIHTVYKLFVGQSLLDLTLKHVLTREGVELLEDFEENCMDELQRSKEMKSFNSVEDRVRKTSDKVEFISMKLDDVNTKLYLTNDLLRNSLAQQHFNDT